MGLLKTKFKLQSSSCQQTRSTQIIYAKLEVIILLWCWWRSRFSEKVQVCLKGLVVLLVEHSRAAMFFCWSSLFDFPRPHMVIIILIQISCCLLNSCVYFSGDVQNINGKIVGSGSQKEHTKKELEKNGDKTKVGVVTNRNLMTSHIH